MALVWRGSVCQPTIGRWHECPRGIVALSTAAPITWVDPYRQDFAAVCAAPEADDSVLLSATALARPQLTPTDDEIRQRLLFSTNAMPSVLRKDCQTNAVASKIQLVSAVARFSK